MPDLLTRPIGRGIAAALVFKLIVLCILWAVFFSDPVATDARAVAGALLSHPEAVTSRNER